MLTVLDDLGVKGEETPIIEVWNKIDLLRPRLARRTNRARSF